MVSSSSSDVFSCACCQASLNLDPQQIFPADTYFEAGNKGTISFASVDESKFTKVQESRFFPFFETIDYWGLQRRRTKLLCASCGKKVGFIYNDGPALTNGVGQYGFGPSQVTPRQHRFRLKVSALNRK